MQPHQRSSRTDIVDLKAQLVKRIGAEKAKRYFYHLNKFLGQNLSKSEFDKFCGRVLGRDNLPLHNLFILSILKNACNAKTPPPSLNELGPSKSAVEHGNEQGGSLGGAHTPYAAVRSNGIILPISPKKGRSRRFRDRPNHVAANSKMNIHPHQSTNSRVVTENGYFNPGSQVSSYGKDQVEAVVVEDREELPHENKLNVCRTPLIAPLGIPFCPASIGGARRAFQVASSSDVVSYYDSGGFYDQETLKIRMEQIAAVQGLEGVSLECATLLNSMLDVYLKRLIKSCVDLAGARSGNEMKSLQPHKHRNEQKLVNDIWPSSRVNILSSNGSMDNIQEKRARCSVSLLDFKVAMELNPQQLGEDWPVLLEKICMRAFED